MSAILFGSKVVHYEVLGRGRPILFLHGWVGSWRYWISAMQTATMNCRAYALDAWGYGDSAKEKSEYLLDRQYAMINEFMDRMGIGRIALVGHGLGALSALLFTQKYPEVVDRLMLIACPFDASNINPRAKTASQLELVDWLIGRYPEAEPVRTDAVKTDPDSVKLSLEDFSAYDFLPILQQLGKPSLLVYGQNDPMISPLKLDEFPEMTHVIHFEQSGHFPMLDENSKFNRLLADFIALGSGISPQQLQLKEEWKRRVR